MLPISSFINHVIFIAKQFKCAWDFLLLQSFGLAGRQWSYIFETSDAGPAARRFEGGPAVECAVCLCRMEHGEEVRDLRCGHVFHKACLDRWLGTGGLTCPLCRNHVLLPRAAALSELRHDEVIVLDAFGGGRSRDRCTGWLR
ncbi:hypothetical protein DM860_000234 [Cuscuta australis]|uniref:RING-type domain-containing protein n=1 Tax=Cuscuta australis TaxID=267555 RepID=A0A328CXZ0_9ASTE|nr:hypothetical protein DM860_000234 [Cuscuta australis]